MNSNEIQILEETLRSIPGHAQARFEWDARSDAGNLRPGGTMISEAFQGLTPTERQTAIWSDFSIRGMSANVTYLFMLTPQELQDIEYEEDLMEDSEQRIISRMQEIEDEGTTSPFDTYVMIRRVDMLKGNGHLEEHHLPWMPQSTFFLSKEPQLPDSLDILPMHKAVSYYLTSQHESISSVCRPSEHPDANVRLLLGETYLGYANHYLRMDSMDPSLALLVSPLAYTPQNPVIPASEDDNDPVSRWLDNSWRKQYSERLRKEEEHAEKVLESLVEGSYLEKEWGPKLREFLQSRREY